MLMEKRVQQDDWDSACTERPFPSGLCVRALLNGHPATGRRWGAGAAQSPVPVAASEGQVRRRVVVCLLWRLACVQFPEASLHLLEGLLDASCDVLSNLVSEISLTIH